MHLQSHQHVLPRSQAVVQVVGLEHDADAPPQAHLGVLVGAVELGAEQADAAPVDVAQAGHQGEKRGLARARRPHQHGQRAARDRERDVEQRLYARVAGTEIVVEMADDDRRLVHGASSEQVGGIGGRQLAHRQNA